MKIIYLTEYIRPRYDQYRSYFSIQLMLDVLGPTQMSDLVEMTLMDLLYYPVITKGPRAILSLLWTSIYQEI